MSDVRLFRIRDVSVEAIPGRSIKTQKKPKSPIMQHVDTLLHVRFVASEQSAGKACVGQTGTLGLEENVCPASIEQALAQ